MIAIIVARSTLPRRCTALFVLIVAIVSCVCVTRLRTRNNTVQWCTGAKDHGQHDKGTELEPLNCNYRTTKVTK